MSIYLHKNSFVKNNLYIILDEELTQTMITLKFRKIYKLFLFGFVEQVTLRKNAGAERLLYFIKETGKHRKGSLLSGMYFTVPIKRKRNCWAYVSSV